MVDSHSLIQSFKTDLSIPNFTVGFDETQFAVNSLASTTKDMQEHYTTNVSLSLSLSEMDVVVIVDVRCCVTTVSVSLSAVRLAVWMM